jgi:RNA polymerase sigma-70 factor (ECF subfamily)
MAQQQDALLIERLKQNDLSAFDELYLKYFKLLCANAYLYLKNEGDAKDLVQNLFMDIWDKKLYLNFHNDVKGYLLLAINNRCLNFIKKQKVQQKKAHNFNVLNESHPDEIDEDEQKMRREQLKGMLSDMKGQKKAAITMVYLNGKKYNEAAEGMGIGVNSLKTHLKAALKKLREGMKTKN